MEHELTKEQRHEMEKGTHDGIERGYTNARDAWKNAAKWVVYKHAQTHETFTANDLRDAIVKIPYETQDGRALGGVLKAAQKANIIEPTGEKMSSVRGHKSQIEIWKSKIYGQGIVATVPSASEKGVVHKLSLHGSELRCSCKGYQYQKRCKHIEEAERTHPKLSI